MKDEEFRALKERVEKYERLKSRQKHLERITSEISNHNQILAVKLPSDFEDKIPIYEEDRRAIAQIILSYLDSELQNVKLDIDLL